MEEHDLNLEDVEFIEVHALLSQFQSTEKDRDLEIILPPHHRCASHTLNLIMTVDACKFTDSVPYNVNQETCEANKHKPGNYSTMSSQVFKKCNLLWNSQNRTTKNADFIKEKLGTVQSTRF